MSGSRAVAKTNIRRAGSTRFSEKRKICRRASAGRSARVVPEAYLASDGEPRRAGVGVYAASRGRVAWSGEGEWGGDGERSEIARRVCRCPRGTVVVAFARRGSRHAPVRSASTTRVGSLHCTRHISPSPSRSRASRSDGRLHARWTCARVVCRARSKASRLLQVRGVLSVVH